MLIHGDNRYRPKRKKKKRKGGPVFKKYKPGFKPASSSLMPQIPETRDDAEHIPSHPLRAPSEANESSKKKKQGHDAPHMREREQKAREKAEKRKKQVAPLYNKGPYQYIDEDTDPEVIRNLGKKV